MKHLSKKTFVLCEEIKELLYTEQLIMSHIIFCKKCHRKRKAAFGHY